MDGYWIVLCFCLFGFVLGEVILCIDKDMWMLLLDIG